MATSLRNDVRLRNKRAFYDAFETTSDTDEEGDYGLQVSASILTTNKHEDALFDAGIARPAEQNDPNRSEQRCIATDATQVPVNLPVNMTLVQTQIDNQRHTSPRRAPATAIPRGPGRSRSTFELKPVPDEQQIFRGLQFYFFPNNDTNPARRLRIVRALEHGASWQKVYNEFVTHVILDLDIDNASILKALELESLPDHVMVVNERWPAECIGYRTQINPDLSRFRPLGTITSMQKTTVETIRQTSSMQPPSSLQLKPAGKDVQAKPPSTPRSSPLEQVTQSSETTSSDDALRKTTLLAPPKSASATRQAEAEFEAVIRQVKQLMLLPIDDDDDDDDADDRPGTADSTSSADSDDLELKKVRNQDAFQCMHSNTGNADQCANASTIAVLQQMSDYYTGIADPWRPRAYRMAIASLRRHPTYITTKAEALKLPKIGPRLAEKIVEIVMTQGLRKLDNVRLEPVQQMLQTFLKVYGAGLQAARRWIEKGYQSLDDVRADDRLTPLQRNGIDHYDDFNIRIPRDEVEKHSRIVEQALHDIDPAYEVIVGGSYRRGSVDSSDIDCIITHPVAQPEQLNEAVSEIVLALTQAGFFKATLSALEPRDGTKWFGASCLPGSKIWRRIDLLLVPADELGAAKIYFTGDDVFTRSIRFLAGKKGLRLNQRGLYKNVMRGRGREKITEGRLIEGRDERKIFEILGVPWVEPHERIIQ